MVKANRKENKRMNVAVRELATINLFLIWVVVIGGFAFLKIVKNHLLN